MRKLLNTLYVTSRDAYLTKEGENVVVRLDEGRHFRVPIHNLEGIVTYGYMGVSPALMGLCVERGVYISFVSNSGRLLAELVPQLVEMFCSERQYELAGADGNLEIARNFVIENYITVG